MRENTVLQQARVGLAVGAVIVSAGLLWYILFLLKDIYVAQETLATLRTRIEQAREAMSSVRAGDLQKKAAAIRQELNAIDSRLPKNLDQVKLLAYIQEVAARRSGVALIEARLGEPVPDGAFQRLPAQVRVRGPLPAQAAFVRNLEASPWLFDYNGVALQRNDEDGAYLASYSLSFFSAR